MTRLAALAAIPLLCCGWTADAQTSVPKIPAGTAMPGAAPPPATIATDAPAALHGRVVAADTGIGLRGAQIRISGIGPATARINRTAITDGRGGYRFDSVPPGQYAITASRPGFVTLRAGQKHPRDQGGRRTLSPSQIERLDFNLPRGSVFVGRLTDDSGEPAVGARLTPLRVFYSAHGERLNPNNSMPFVNPSDDRGEFRVAGLSPGTYLLAAEHQSNETGESLVTTYYPGTTNVHEARRFRIGLSEQVTADFSMQARRLVRISGHVQSSDGRPLQNARMFLRTDVGLGAKGGRVEDASGRFDISGVAPGEYRLDVSRTGTGGLPDFFKQTEFASVKLSVGDEDLTGLIITTGAGATVTGRVVYERSSAKPATAPNGRVTTMIQDGPYGMRPPSADQNNGVIAEDGSFTTVGGYGKMLFRVAQPGWHLKSVMLDGIDITDVPYDASRGSIKDLEIVMTDSRQELSGTVTDALGKPSTSYGVFVFPADLKEGAVPDRFVRIAGAREDGVFRIINLPPGRYLAAAFETIDPEAQYDPEFREIALRRAIPFNLSPGQALNLELSLIE